MKKLAGLFAFAVALAGAIILTQYYASRTTTPPVPPAPPAAPSAPPAPVGANAPVTFKTQLVTLDFAAKKAHVTLNLERDPAQPAPGKVWVWAYFFTPEGERRYCAGEPVEVSRPFDAGSRAPLSVDVKVSDCAAPKTASSTYYARVNVSTESAFAAKLTEQRISYDITQASPVTIEGATPKKN